MLRSHPAIVALALAAATIVVITAAIRAPGPAAARRMALAHQMRAGEAAEPHETCTVHPTKTLSPQLVEYGGGAEVGLEVDWSCRDLLPEMHLVLVVDETDKDSVLAAQEFAADLRDRLLPADDGYTLVGLVSYRSTARTICELTDSAARFTACIQSLEGRRWAASIDDGLREGLKVLIRGRGSGRQELDAREIIVLWSSQPNDVGCPPVEMAANQAKNQGVLVVGICATADCDDDCIRMVSSSPRYFYTAEMIGDVVDVLVAYQQETVPVDLSWLEITERLSPRVRYVEGSAVPEPDSIAREQGVLSWKLEQPTGSFTALYRIDPLALGSYSTSLRTDVWFRDSLQRRGGLDFVQPLLTVTAPEDTSACHAWGESEVHVGGPEAQVGRPITATLLVSWNCPEVVVSPGAEPVTLELATLDVTAKLAPGVDYAEGSAAPPPAYIGPHRRHLRWRTSPVSERRNSYSLQIRPRRPGELLSLVTGSAAFTDTSGRPGETSIHVPELTILPGRTLYIPVAERGATAAQAR